MSLNTTLADAMPASIEYSHSTNIVGRLFYYGIMEYTDFFDKIGNRYSIVEGELVESIDGMFPVTDYLASPAIYVDKLHKKVSLVSPKSSYIGRKYGLRLADCVGICFQWHDDNFNTKLYNIYVNTSNRDFYEQYKLGMSAWFEKYNFNKINLVEDISIGDMLIYEKNMPGAISHIAVCTEPGKVLSHIPHKLSSIDTIDYTKINGIYRHG